MKRDVEAALGKGPDIQTTPPASPAMPQPAPSFAYAGEGVPYEEKMVSQMREDHCPPGFSQSKFSAPHFYLTMEVDMERTIAIRKQINEVAPVKISFNDLVIKASAAALRQHPGGQFLLAGGPDPLQQGDPCRRGHRRGRRAGRSGGPLHGYEIAFPDQPGSQILRRKGQGAQTGARGVQGNTFTISNLGMFGIEEFTAIINPPDACILAVGSIVEKPVVKDGQIVIGQRMKLTLSCDHRVVDGATGAKFLETLKGILEDPIRLLV